MIDLNEPLTIRERAIESAESRFKMMKFNYENSHGGKITMEKKKRQVEIAEYILEAVKAYEPD